MKRQVKKQIWLTEEEEELLEGYAQKTCLTESSFLRMVMCGCIPKEKPDKEFYERMRQMDAFMQRLEYLIELLKYGEQVQCEELNSEIHRWHQFQLDVEERFLAPEKVPWL